MKPGKVRPIAICVFSHQGKILVAEGYDSVKQQTFYRPLGGKIEFGETGAETVRREIEEELELQCEVDRFLGVFENIFVFEGQKGHEIVLVYDGKFSDPRIYLQAELFGHENNDEFLKAVWKPLSEFNRSRSNEEIAPLIDPLYPTGLLELLQGLP
jgi:8-oxo-dGTP pyrophosphatase MutT (NUDIX family)